MNKQALEAYVICAALRKVAFNDDSTDSILWHSIFMQMERAYHNKLTLGISGYPDQATLDKAQLVSTKLSQQETYRSLILQLKDLLPTSEFFELPIPSQLWEQDDEALLKRLDSLTR